MPWPRRLLRGVNAVHDAWRASLVASQAAPPPAARRVAAPKAPAKPAALKATKPKSAYRGMPWEMQRVIKVRPQGRPTHAGPPLALGC